MLHRALLLAGSFLLAHCAVAQQAPLKGVVWSAPTNIRQALQDLAEIRALGANAVRTELVADRLILDAADSLGLVLFQDLPLEHLSAPDLSDTLRYALLLLDGVLEQDTGGASPVRYYGLASFSDTSSPRSCEYFARLTNRLHQRPGRRSYYRSPFARDDLCSSEVDLVLIDTPAGASPADNLGRWRRNTPAGIAGLGTTVSDRTEGLLQPYSPQAQARYLETHLSELLDGPEAPFAVFVYRYRDLHPTSSRGFGLVTATGQGRPARDVVRGIYTGSQSVFAFAPGQRPPVPTPWNLVMGWITIGLLSACFALSSRFRDLLRRYFVRHGFYRDSLRDGRELRLRIALPALAVVALCAGVFGSVLLEALGHEPAIAFLIAAMPERLQLIAVYMQEQTWPLVLVLALISATIAIVWAAGLAAFSPVRFKGTLTIVTWTFWAQPILTCLALAVPSLAPPTAGAVMIALCAAWILATFISIVRVTLDFGAVCSVRRSTLVVLAVCNPAVVLLLGGLLTLALWQEAANNFGFFWHLATRS